MRDYPCIELGDVGNRLQSWRWAGASRSNTNRRRVYIDLAESFGDALVIAYSDKARTNVVAQGIGALSVSGGTTTRIELAEVDGSGLTMSVFAFSFESNTNIILHLALCGDRDIEDAEDYADAFQHEAPNEQGFDAMHRVVTRAFTRQLYAAWRPRQLSSHELDTAPSSIPLAGTAIADYRARFLWSINADGDWEITGLENPDDFVDFAILLTLAEGYRRRSGLGNEEQRQLRGDLLERRAWQTFRKSPIEVDEDGDSISEGEVQRVNVEWERG